MTLISYPIRSIGVQCNTSGSPVRTIGDHTNIHIEYSSKLQYFNIIPVKTTYKATNIADIFLKQNFWLHGILKVIISDRDPKFTGNFWKYLFKGLNTTLNFSTSFHPQIDGQTINQVLEDLLRMYVKDQPGKWEDYLHLVEFAYESLYGRKCNTPISWSNQVDRLVLGT